MDRPNETDFAARARRARLRLLAMHHRAGVGHLGGNLSAIDALLALHHDVMRPEDRFILAKGHAAGALYVTLWTTGELEESELDRFHAEGTKLAGHPAPNWTPGIPLATGSLGHGFPVACGIALANRLESRAGHVFCLTSDGEWQEGSNWEALAFASHQKLSGLTLLVDANGLQGFGSTREVASQGPDELVARFQGFGVRADSVDGHDGAALTSAIREAAESSEMRAVVLRTTKGKGVSFMEDRLEWHYLPLDDALYAQAVAEVEAG